MHGVNKARLKNQMIATTAGQTAMTKYQNAAFSP